jgi:hypothetical protein
MRFGPLQAAQAQREQALAALDAGQPRAAFAACQRGLATLERAALGRTLPAIALLVALAEIEESLGCIDDATATATAAMAALDVLGRDGDERVVLWCQVQERLATLARLAGDPDTARRRLRALRHRAAGSFGETSYLAERAASALDALDTIAAPQAALV